MSEGIFHSPLCAEEECYCHKLPTSKWHICKSKAGWGLLAKAYMVLCGGGNNNFLLKWLIVWILFKTIINLRKYKNFQILTAHLQGHERTILYQRQNCMLLTVLQAAPLLHIQIDTGKPAPTRSPSAQRDTKCPTGRTGSRKSMVYDD